MTENLTGKLVKFKTGSSYVLKFPLENKKYGIIIKYKVGYIIYSFSRGSILTHTFADPERSHSSIKLIEKIK